MVINLGSWQFWLVLIIIVFIIIWFLWGGNRDYNIVGIKPLIDLANTVPDTNFYSRDIENNILNQTQYKHNNKVIETPTIYEHKKQEYDINNICYAVSPKIINKLPNENRIIQNENNRNDPNSTINLDNVKPEQLRFILDYIPYLKYTKEKKGKISMGESLTGKIFEEYLGRSVMKSIRPDILKNIESGSNCEYDIYDDYTRIAIEYSGEQHYVYPHHWHKNEKSFTDLIYRDKLKAKLSEENDILLIIVPYWVDSCKADPTAPNGYKVLPNSQLTPDIREAKLKAYLIPILEEIFNGK
jgi:hypothetical protein